MKWFLVYVCDEDTVNTTTTYKDLILAENEAEAIMLANLSYNPGMICIGARPASDEEVALMSR